MFSIFRQISWQGFIRKIAIYFPKTLSMIKKISYLKNCNEISCQSFWHLCSIKRRKFIPKQNTLSTMKQISCLKKLLTNQLSKFLTFMFSFFWPNTMKRLKPTVKVCDIFVYSVYFDKLPFKTLIGKITRKCKFVSKSHFKRWGKFLV